MVHSSKNARDRGMTIKLDMANAFDRVRRSFLFAVMKKFGFEPLFIRWVKAYIGTPWISPLMNGRSTGYFRASQGLRQGCLLSTLLYIIMEYYLSQKMEIERRLGRLRGIQIAR